IATPRACGSELTIVPAGTPPVVEGAVDLTGANFVRSVLEIQGDFTVGGTHDLDLYFAEISASHTINVTNTGQTLFSSGIFGSGAGTTLTKTGPSTLQTVVKLAGLSITQGTVKLLPHIISTEENSIGVLSFQNGSLLDIDDNRFISHITPVGTF